MILNWFARNQRNKIKDSEVDQQIEAICQDLVRLGKVLSEKLIDLGLDTTSFLPISKLLTTGSPSSTTFLNGLGAWVAGTAGLSFVPRPDNYITGGVYVMGDLGAVGWGQSATVSNGGSLVDTDGNWIRLNTAGAGTVCLMSVSAGSVGRIQHNPTLICYVRTGSSLATIRLFANMNGTGSSTNSDTMNSPGVSIRFSTTATDPGWVGVAWDGVTQSVTTLIKAVAVSTIYKLQITISGNGTLATFTVNDDTANAKTLTTNLATTQNCRPGMVMMPTAAGAKVLDVACAMMFVPQKSF